MRRVLLFLFFISAGLRAQPTLKWAQSIGSYNDETSYSVTDAHGNLYATGYFSGNVDFDPGPGVYNLSSPGQEVYLSKTDSAGNLVWAKKTSSLQCNCSTAWGIALDKNCNIYITGVFAGDVDFDPGPDTFKLSTDISQYTNYDVFVSKFDSGGNFIWVRQLGGQKHPGDYEMSYSIAVDDQGYVYTAGCFNDTADFDPGPTVYKLYPPGPVIFLSKLDSMGNFVWARQLGNAGLYLDCDLAIDKDANVYITGPFQGHSDFDPGAGTFYLTSQGEDDIFLMKLNRNGNMIWCHQLGGGGWDKTSGIAIGPQNRLFVTGYYRDTLYFDNTLLAGAPIANNNDHDALIAGFSTGSGALLWLDRIGDSGYDYGTALSVNSKNNLLVAGIANSVDFDPGPGVHTITGFGGFLCELDNNGNFICAGLMPGGVTSTSVSFDALDNVYLSGSILGTVDMDPGLGNVALSTPNYSNPNFFHSKMRSCYFSTGQHNVSENDNKLIVYPNPAGSDLSITYSMAEPGSLQVSCYDLLGQPLFSEKCAFYRGEYQKKINTSELRKGILVLEVIEKGSRTIKRVVIE